jgi:NitT/TauT family transport system substrate-binding protein
MRISLIAALLAASLSLPAHAEKKDNFSVCWTIYAGWMPWEFGAAEGIVDKWAKKYDINIDVVQINDYVESINQYSTGQFDGCSMTNMDALTIPAAGGVDSTALIIGDFSNGNDGIVIKGEDKSVADLKGMSVNLVELSVSHYLLARGLESVGLAEKDLKVVNTSDADMVAAFTTNDVQAAVTWNPLLAEIAATPNTTKVFDSSQIPGEIIDLMVVNSDTLKDNPAFGKALTGAWYEIMATMSADTPAGDRGTASTWLKRPAPIWPVIKRNWLRPRCSTTPRMPWPSPTARSTAGDHDQGGRVLAYPRAARRRRQEC